MPRRDMPPAADAGARPGGAAAKTYVLVHGAWHGGWCWRPVAEALRAHGHRVFAPTQTGLGERRHLLSRDVTLDVFVDDVANLMEVEELRGAILVGHSFGGNAVSGVADRMPKAVRHLVYLDSLVLEPGQSPFGALPAEVVAARRKLAAEQGGGVSIPPPPPAAFGIPENHPETEWVRRRLTRTRWAPTRARCVWRTRSATACPAPTSPAPRRPTGRSKRRAGG